jgi:hypothetical protein
MKPQINDVRGSMPRAHHENESRRALTDISTGVWHYDAVHAPDSYDPMSRYRGEASYHINKVWGYDSSGRPLYGYSIMYHYKVDRWGQIWWLNDLELITWHARGANGRGVALCTDLGEGQEPTAAQVASMRALSDWLSYERPDVPNLQRADWFGHGELKADGNVTLCPGKMLPFVQAYRAGSNPPLGQRYFGETGLIVAGAFLQFWEAKGSQALPLFGYPISPEQLRRLEDGNLYRVQYFERARFEQHGESIELGRLGAELYDRSRMEQGA